MGRKFVLGVDVGTVTGLTRVYEDGVASPYSAKLKKDFGARLHGLAMELERHIDGNCRLVVIEKPFGKFCGIDVVQGMFGVAVETCERLGAPYAWVHLMTLKKAATGNGKAKKGEMMLAAKERFGMDMNEHEADAAHCAGYGWDVLLRDG